MYVRVKRSKTTIFLHVEPTDTVLEVKQKLQELVQQVLLYRLACGTFRLSVLEEFWSVQAPETQRLYLGKSTLEDARQLAELKVENDDVLALTYQQSGTERVGGSQCLDALQICYQQQCTWLVTVQYGADGSWEDVNVAEYVPEMDSSAHS